MKIKYGTKDGLRTGLDKPWAQRSRHGNLTAKERFISVRVEEDHDERGSSDFNDKKSDDRSREREKI